MCGDELREMVEAYLVVHDLSVDLAPLAVGLAILYDIGIDDAVSALQERIIGHTRRSA